MSEAKDESWSRALMATSGMSVGTGRATRVPSPGLHRAADPELSRNELHELAKSRDGATREAIAARHDCPLGVLISLAHDARADVRVAAAANECAAPAVLDHLARDRDAAVLKAVARNPATPLAIVEKLSFSRREDVRRVAAKELDRRTGDSTGAEVVAVRAPAPPRAPELLDGHRAGPTLAAAGEGARDQPRTLAPRPQVGPAPPASSAVASPQGVHG